MGSSPFPPLAGDRNPTYGLPASVLPHPPSPPLHTCGEGDKGGEVWRFWYIMGRNEAVVDRYGIDSLSDRQRLLYLLLRHR